MVDCNWLVLAPRDREGRLRSEPRVALHRLLARSADIVVAFERFFQPLSADLLEGMSDFECGFMLPVTGIVTSPVKHYLGLWPKGLFAEPHRLNILPPVGALDAKFEVVVATALFQLE